MVAFLSIALAVGLLGLTVYGLHKYQTMEVEYNIDRSAPLPPLSGKSRPKTPDPVEAQEGQRRQEPRAEASVEASRENNWQDKVTALKQTGELEAALACCAQEYPLWGAYNQACIILRNLLKQEDCPAEELDRQLHRLYRLAAVAELLHDKSGESAHLTLNQLKQLDLPLMDTLEMPYSELGYAHLRLIRKSDIKLMTSAWGRPRQHGFPRVHHQHWWNEFSSRVV